MFGALLAVLTAVNRCDAPALARAGVDAGAPSGDAVADSQRAVRADPGSAAAYAGLGDAYLAARARDRRPVASTRAPSARSTPRCAATRASSAP